MKRLPFLLLPLLCACSDQNPTLPPPPPYTNKEIASLYWQSAIQTQLAEPDSFKVVSEVIDSFPAKFESRELYNDSTIVYFVDAKFIYKNQFGGWSKCTKSFSIVPNVLISIDSDKQDYKRRGFYYITSYATIIDDVLIEANEKVIERTKAYNAYQDSIQNTTPCPNKS